MPKFSSKPDTITLALPKVLAKLGKVLQLGIFSFWGNYEDPQFRMSGQKAGRLWKLSRHYLTTDATGKTLFLVKPPKKRIPRGGTVARRQADIDKAAKMFATWNQYEAHEIETLEHDYGYKRSYSCVGFAGELIYHSKKWDDNADYRHSFNGKTPPKVYVPTSYLREYDYFNWADLGGVLNDCPIIIIKGGKLKTTKRGIEG